MDPNATLQSINKLLSQGGSVDEVDVLCQDLYNWLVKGGFQPNWDAYKLACIATIMSVK